MSKRSNNSSSTTSLAQSSLTRSRTTLSLADKCRLRIVHRSDEKRTQRVGDDVEIVYAGSDPATTIVIRADRSSTWDRLALAYKFAFPHQQNEFDAYGKYINYKFSQHETAF